MPAISIHVPLRERQGSKLHAKRGQTFQSTLPCGSDESARYVAKYSLNFNPRSLAGATYLAAYFRHSFFISIHAPLRERQNLLIHHVLYTSISIHAPLRERRYLIQENRNAENFNPRSLAGATSCRINVCLQPLNFNPRSLAGATVRTPRSQSSDVHFNPRSLAGATASAKRVFSENLISIHAPLRERQSVCSPVTGDQHFNPRSLAGATMLMFQSLVTT